MILDSWYAHRDVEFDVGDWVVTNSPDAPMEMDIEKGDIVIASFVSQELATHIADVHNEWLTRCHREIQYHATPHRGCILR